MYYEHRNKTARGTDSIAADIARHIHSRQQLGTVLIICDQPVAMLSAIRKQWMRLTRTVQRQRASTLNADKILKYTRSITQMQHIRFTTKQPSYLQDAAIYCLESSDELELPKNCFSVYTLLPLSFHRAQTVVQTIARDALVIDYNHQTAWAAFGLQPKKVLEDRVETLWGQFQTYLRLYHIETHELHNGINTNVRAMDDALDTLLDVGPAFLAIANTFQRAMSLARPLRLRKSLRLEYDAVILLAHRVQALSPGTFSHRFLDAYSEDDSLVATSDTNCKATTDSQKPYCIHLVCRQNLLNRSLFEVQQITNIASYQMYDKPKN